MVECVHTPDDVQIAGEVSALMASDSWNAEKQRSAFGRERLAGSGRRFGEERERPYLSVILSVERRIQLFGGRSRDQRAVD
jgi:hypothetical protein